MTGPTEDRAGAEALVHGAAARRVDRDVLSVTGPDAATYLQGQCSQDVEGLPLGASADTLILSPQGKVDAYARVTRTGDEAFVLDVDPGCGPAAQARLERFRLRTKVEIERLDWACLSVRGPAAADAVVPDGPALVAAARWPGWSGVDLFGPAPGDDPALDGWRGDGVVACAEEAWEAARIEAGVPVGGREVTDATIAAEVGLVDRTVSFTKGCFTGQELVARLDARGSKVARRLWGLVVDGEASPPVGATAWTVDGAHEVGTLSSVAHSGRLGAAVALAVLHRRVGAGDRVTLRWDDQQASAELRALPLTAT